MESSSVTPRTSKLWQRQF